MPTALRTPVRTDSPQAPGQEWQLADLAPVEAAGAPIEAVATRVDPKPVDSKPVDPTAVRELLERAQLGGLTTGEVEQLVARMFELARAPDRAAADLLLEAISLDSLAVYRHQGLTLQNWATEALIDLGHPYALEVPPEALEEALANRAAQERRRNAPWIGWGLMAAGGVISLGTALQASSDLVTFATTFGVIVESAAYALPTWAASSRTGTFKRHLGMVGIAALGLLEIWIGLTWGRAYHHQAVWQLVFGGAVKLLAVPFFSLRRKRRAGSQR